MDEAQHDATSASLLLNVAIIPPNHVANEAIDLSRQTQALGGLFKLNHITRFPHVTIFMARFSRSKINAVREILSAIAPTFEEQTLDHKGYHLTAHKYYEVSYTKTPGLLWAQASIASKLREFRYAPGDPVIEKYFGEYKDGVKKSAEEWGYDLMGDLYRPHLTLTRFPAGSQIGPQELLPASQNNLSFSLAHIGLFQADDMGAARELISEWKIE